VVSVAALTLAGGVTPADQGWSHVPAVRPAPSMEG